MVQCASFTFGYSAFYSLCKDMASVAKRPQSAFIIAERHCSCLQSRYADPRLLRSLLLRRSPAKSSLISTAISHSWHFHILLLIHLLIRSSQFITSFPVFPYSQPHSQSQSHSSSSNPAGILLLLFPQIILTPCVHGAPQSPITIPVRR